ncbi:MAG: alpha/beta fold hydrolase, partial [Terriglobales bacterium]
MFRSTSRRLAMVMSLSLTTALGAFTCTPSPAAVVRDNTTPIVEGVPTNCWQDTARKPKAVVIALHGLVMHGGVFDTIARHLASEGMIVIAPDMRGFGRWIAAGTALDGDAEQPQLDYDRSFKDLSAIVRSTKERYPNLPTFCMGESLGAVIALRAAGEMGDSIDGIILSSPAIKHHSFVKEIAEQAGPFIANPFRHVNLIPYIKKFASEDPKIVQGALDDPLVRKRMTALELLKSANAIKPALGYADRVPSNMPVLIIQGNKDRMVKSNAVVLCLTHL